MSVAVLTIEGKLVINIAVASTRASAKYTPYIAHFIFTHLSFLTSSLLGEAPERQPAEDRRQHQTTITRTRRRPFKRPASEHHRRFNQSIDQIELELRYRPSPNQIKA